MRTISKIYVVVILLVNISIVGLCASTHAANVAAKLGSTNGSDSFVVEDSVGTALMSVLSDGKVNIGTLSPSNEKRKRKVHISGTTDHTEVAISSPVNKFSSLEFWEEGTRKWAVEKTTSNNLVVTEAGVEVRMIFVNGGNVGIGTISPNYRLDVRGSIGNNTTTYHSDIRWKRSISNITDALDKVTNLRGVNFEWKAGEFPEMAFAKGTKLGFIAQEVEEVLPEVVDTGSDGYKSVQYANIVPLLVEAVKELKNKNKALEQEFKEAKTENEQLRRSISAIAARQDTLDTMFLAISAKLPKENLIKYDLTRLDKLQEIVQ